MIQLLFMNFFSIFLHFYLSFPYSFTLKVSLLFSKSLLGKPFSSIYQFYLYKSTWISNFLVIFKSSFSISNNLKFHVLLIFRVWINTNHQLFFLTVYILPSYFLYLFVLFQGTNQRESSHFHFPVLYLVFYKHCRYKSTRIFYFSIFFYVFINHELLILCLFNF